VVVIRGAYTDSRPYHDLHLAYQFCATRASALHRHRLQLRASWASSAPSTQAISPDSSASHLSPFSHCLRQLPPCNVETSSRNTTTTPPPPRPLLLTVNGVAIIAPVHVELAPRRREAVTLSGRRGRAGRCGGQVRPGHGGGVVDVQVMEVAACAVASTRR
jgi:hypothetical protein